MTMNNYLDGVLKGLKEKYRFAARYCQSTAMSTLLGIILGTLRSPRPPDEALRSRQALFHHQERLRAALHDHAPPADPLRKRLEHEKAAFFQKHRLNNFIRLRRDSNCDIHYSSSHVADRGCRLRKGKRRSTKDYNFYYCFIFGSLISATDPVSVLSAFKEMNAHSKLYSLIFGESIFNDAISLTLYRCSTLTQVSARDKVQALADDRRHHLEVLVPGVLLGPAWPGFRHVLILGSGRLTRILKKVKFTSTNHKTQALSVMLIIPWVCYLFAEIISISGIVSIMFCGIAMAHYAVENITAEARENIKDIYHAVSSNCESLAFIFIGVAVFGFQHNLRYAQVTQLDRLRHHHTQLLRHALRTLLQHIRHLLHPVFLEVHAGDPHVPVRHLVRRLPRRHGYSTLTQPSRSRSKPPICFLKAASALSC